MLIIFFEWILKEVCDLRCLIKLSIHMKIKNLYQIFLKWLVYIQQNAKNERCRKCNYTSSSKKSLQKHVNEQHPRRIECDSCDQTFGNNHELETHVEEHKAQKNFKCDVCDKGFYLQ